MLAQIKITVRFRHRVMLRFGDWKFPTYQWCWWFAFLQSSLHVLSVWDSEHVLSSSVWKHCVCSCRSTGTLWTARAPVFSGFLRWTMSVFVNGCKDTGEAKGEREKWSCNTWPVSLTSWAERDTKLPFPALAASQMLTSGFLELSYWQKHPGAAGEKWNQDKNDHTLSFCHSVLCIIKRESAFLNIIQSGNYLCAAVTLYFFDSFWGNKMLETLI